MARVRRSWRGFAGVAWGVVCVGGLLAVGVGAAQPAPPKVAEPVVPGWYVQVSSGGKEQAKLHASHAAYWFDTGETLSGGVPAREGSTHTGRVAIEVAGKYRFGVEATGATARLTVYGSGSTKAGEVSSPGGAAKWTGWIDLPVGAATVSVSTTRAGNGPTSLRTLWEKEGVGKAGFRPEPIPVSSVSVPAFGLKPVAEAESSLRGRVLLGELGCVNCHSTGAGGSNGSGAPKAEATSGERADVLRRMGPDLSAVGARVAPAFLRRWVAEPQSIKPGCGMPDVIGDTPKDAADTEAIVHFLASLGGPMKPEPLGTEEQGVDLGRRLYHTVGCVACHGALEPAAKVFGEGSPAALPTTPAAHPFGIIAGKWKASSLAEFLREPHKARPSGRMPSLSLSTEESDLIATYLLRTWGTGENLKGESGDEFAVDPAKSAVGRAAFAARGCAACHEFGAEQPGWKGIGKPMAKLSAGKGCMSATDKTTPRYTLSAAQRADLATGVAAMGKPSASAAPIEHAMLVVGALGCRNCHERDGIGGPADDIKSYFRTSDETELGDEGRFPPRITGVGAKLTPEWLRKVLVDGGRARPYMGTRMPQFGEKIVGDLHPALAAADGLSTAAEPAGAKATDELVQAGRRLVGERGMNCISCHTFGGKSAGTAGPEITAFADRLRASWWKPYIMDPQRFKPGTRMTAFFESGRGTIPDVLGGDANRQSEALWAYFAMAKDAPPPEGLPSGADLPLAIADRPVVFRTFLKDAGSRGIAVGYPGGVHFAFDAENVRLVSAWNGEFMDATGAWKGRGGNVTSGRGPTIWTAPKGPGIVIGARPEKWPEATGAPAGYRFRGYTLDEAGAPSFSYLVGEGVTVEEKFEPAELGRVIRRTFTLRGLAAGTTVWVNVGDKGAGSRAIANVDKVSEVGDEVLRLLGVTAKESGIAVVFAIEIKP
ncbi:MAG: c-type cytochrome [Phycisphaerales bacterium]